MASVGNLSAISHGLRDELEAAHSAREVALPLCRKTIRSASLAIRAIHRGLAEEYEKNVSDSEASIRAAQDALAKFPDIAAAGFIHDAEKEYAEARLTRALVSSSPLPMPADIGVRTPAWLNGLAEAASELRRNMLDRLRQGETDKAEELLSNMEDVYDALVTVDFPDAITGGLRRTTDALRAVVERSRSDLTMTNGQERLRQALERHGAS